MTIIKEMKGFKYIKPKRQPKDADPFVIQTGKGKNSRLSMVNRCKWSEDVYIADKKERETIGQNFNVKILPWLALALAFFLAIILAKTAWLQVVKGEYYYGLAEGNRLRIERVEPRRGVIYDRTGRTLVRNKANFLLYFIPIDLPDDENELHNIVTAISRLIVDPGEEEIYKLLSVVDWDSLEVYQPLFIVDKIPYEEAMRLYLASDNWPGVVLSQKTNREYLVYGVDNQGQDTKVGHSLSHIIGYTGKINQAELDSYGDEYWPIDYIGKMGIEYFWENELKGESGKKHIEVDALGKEKKLIKRAEAKDGHNIVLSIDTYAQVKLEEILIKQLDKLELTRAVAVVLDPSSGEVLAMVSLPAYDNNAFARGISIDDYQTLISHQDKPLFNRAVSGEYPSGSTIKPVWAAAALEERIVSENTTFLSVGGIRIGQWFFPDWRAGGHGRVDVRRAIAESVNTYFYNIGGGYEDFRGLGVDRMVEYGELFGLGTQTGIDLAGEASGFLPTRSWKEEVKGERWYIGDTYHMAIGQGDLLVTPLQVAQFTSVFANGGKLYRPHFIRQVLTGDDEPFSAVHSELVRENFIDAYNIHVVREGMRRTVTDGSARSLQSVPVAVAGKTGTAQWSSKNDHHAWFTGFAPFDNPKLAITVLIEEGGEGSDTAVPVVKEFLTWYFGEYKGKDARVDG